MMEVDVTQLRFLGPWDLCAESIFGEPLYILQMMKIGENQNEKYLL
jgi:hypothetical protein